MMDIKAEICKAFSKYAASYEKAAKVQQEIGKRLLARLHYLKITPRYILDLGCGAGTFTLFLKKHYPQAIIIGLDLSHAMLQQAKKKQGWRNKWPLLNGDMINLPFSAGLFDLIFANQVIHWSDSLAKLMAELNRVMSKQACLMFSTLGPDTFWELRQAWQGISNFAHNNHFADMHDVGDCLLREHFLDPVVDMEKLTVLYTSVKQLARSLKLQGVRNINRARNKGLTGKKAWQAFESAYQALCTEEAKYPLTYEVIYGHAWKGDLRRAHGAEAFIPLSQIKRISNSG